jgi:RNA polymerase primary sigma factor
MCNPEIKKGLIDMTEYTDDLFLDKSEYSNDTDDIVEKAPSEEVRPSLAQEASATDDSIKIYLKEMGIIPLLTKGGEIEVAKGIEKGMNEISKILFATPFIVNKIILLRDELRKGQITIRELVSDLEESPGSHEAEIRKKFLQTINTIQKRNSEREHFLKTLRRKGISTKTAVLTREKLQKNRKLVFDRISALSLREDIIHAFSEEFKETVSRVEELKKISAPWRGDAGNPCAR